MTATISTGAYRCPVDVPGPGGDTPIARESLWWDYATGTDHPLPRSWAGRPVTAAAEYVAPPPIRGHGTVLPLGTTDLLDAAPYPHGRVRGAGIEHALVAAFGLSRREPDDPFNDHRAYASARCLFPVRAVLVDGGRARLVDPDRHALIDLHAPDPGGPAVVLTGRYPVVPDEYRFLRGSIVALETGIALRALAVALQVCDLPARLRLPGPDGVAHLAGLGLTPTTDWSLPLTLELPGHRGRAAAAVPVAEPAVADPVLADVLTVNRAQSAADLGSMGSFLPLSGVNDPMLPQGHGLSWAELLWRRSSGRMPRGLHGMAARPRRLPASALAEAAASVSQPPPEPLRDVFDAVRVTAVVRGVDGTVDGVHRIDGGGARLVEADPAAMARLEDAYFYPLTPGSGCDVRHAPMTFLLSVRPRPLVERYGPGAWTAAQYAAGWAAHGLALAGAAAGLFARPVRAFRETDVQRLAHLDPDETVLFAVVTGTPRHVAGPQLDLRL